jgi:hypothetical protein
MTRIRTWGVVATLASVCALVALAGHPVHAYQDSMATINKPGADIADTYLFPSPSNSQNLVAIMTVHPLIPAGKTTFFDQSVLYQMKFDNALGAASHVPKENLVIQFSMGPVVQNTQQIFVYGPSFPNQVGTKNTLVTATGTGVINKTFAAGSISVRAGVFEDPSFYDRAQLLNIFPNRNRGSMAPSCLSGGTNACPQGFNNPGNDSQGNMNVLAIVVEMPRATLIGPNGNTKVAYWATTSSETGN